MLIFGLAMVLVMIWRPRGLLAGRTPSASLFEHARDLRGACQGGARLMSSNADGEILRVEHLTMRFGGLIAVNECPSRRARGDITAIIGPNGAGKTTVFNCITGFYKPTDGSMRARRTTDGSSSRSSGCPAIAIAKQRRVARTFQNIRLFAGMTVLENLLVAQHNALKRASGYTVVGLLGLSSYARAERAAIERAALLARRETGLLDRADDPAGDLPYGAQRRLEIARAMCTEPVLLCLDEPAAGLNPRETGELNELLLKIRDEHALSHPSDRARHGRGDGHLRPYRRARLRAQIAEGTPAEIRADPSVIAAYLGVGRGGRRGRGGGSGRMTARLLRPRRRDLLRRDPGAEGRRSRRPRGRDRYADRLQRRGQIHADDDDLRQSARTAPARSVLTAATSRGCRRTRSRGSPSRSRPRAGAFSRA